MKFSFRKYQKQYHLNGWSVYLKGKIYNADNEAEFIATGLNKKGLEIIKELNGGFLLIIQNGNKTWVVRDRYGIIPVYYFKGDKIYVSDKISDLPHINKENTNYSRQWMVFNNCLTDETIFEGVNKLEKGTIWDGVVSNKYWKWEFKPEKMDYEEAKLTLRMLIIRAIDRMKPKCDYGAFLSGGVDSNIINLFTNDCYTFTAGFTEGNDERGISELFGKKHYNVVYNKMRYLEDSIKIIETPLVGASWYNVGVTELASKYINKCYDGGGADELFGSYHWRYDMEKDYYDIVNRTGLNDCRDIFNKYYKDDNLNNRFLFDVEYFLEGVLTVCVKIADHFGVELIAPFLDNDVVDFAIQLPVDFKMGKRILKDAFPELPEICKGAKKGFSSPDWIGGEGNKAYNWSNKALEIWRKQLKYL